MNFLIIRHKWTPAHLAFSFFAWGKNTLVQINDPLSRAAIFLGSLSTRWVKKKWQTALREACCQSTRCESSENPSQLSASCPQSLFASAFSQSTYALDRKWFSFIDSSPWTEPKPRAIQHLLPTLTCSCFNCLRGGEVTSANQAKILWEYARGPDNKLSNVLFLHQFHVKLNNVNYYCRKITNKRQACMKISRSSKWDAGVYQPCDLWHKGRTHIVPFCSRLHSSGQSYPVTFSFTCVPASVSTSQWWEW